MFSYNNELSNIVKAITAGLLNLYQNFLSGLVIWRYSESACHSLWGHSWYTQFSEKPFLRTVYTCKWPW